MAKPVIKVNNYFLYEISHPNKHGEPLHDLSITCSEVTDENLSIQQVKLERVIKRTFAEYEVHHPVTDRLRAMFKTKLWRMGQRLSKLGSIKRKALLDSWKCGENAVWELHVDMVETNRQLLKVKRKNEQELKSERVKRQKLEENVTKSKETMQAVMHEKQEMKNKFVAMEKELKKAKVLNERLTKSNRKLSSSIVRQNQQQRRKRQQLSSLSRQQQWVRKKQLSSDVSQALSFLDDEGVSVSAVTLIHNENDKSEVVNIKEGVVSEKDECSTDLELVLYVKEHFGLSNLAYHELSMVCQGLPRSWKLKHLAKNLNSKWNITPCPGGDGVQQSLEARLTERVALLLSEKKLSPGDTLKVKLSGDGTKVCRKLNLINFTFTLLNEGDVAMSSRGNHTKAIINACEGYEVLKKTLADIIDEVEQLKTVEVNGQNFAIEYFICSDWKFLAIICGIESATSTYPCVWCKCPSSERYDMQKEWSTTDPDKGARTIADIISCHTKPKKRKYSCAHPPLFKTIPIDHVIPDILHLYLRITDVLFNLLILDIRRQDGVEKSAVTSSGLSKLENFLNDTCHIPFKFSVNKDTKQLQWRDLMGPEKLILFEKINLIALFPSMPKIEERDLLWKNFARLHKKLHFKSVTATEANEIGESAKSWIQDFISIYQTKNVTPYMHALAMHIPEFIKTYGNLVQFTQQGMEKLNDQTTIDFARSTNHNFRNLEALKQLMEKKNRIEYLEDNGFQRIPRNVTCSHCNESGHNVLTCPQKK